MSAPPVEAAIDRARANIAELAALIATLDEGAVNQAIEIMTSANRLFFAGIGRSGLSSRAIAMRLMHTGLTTYVVGDTTTPAIGKGDLLVAVSSSGSGALHEQALKARRAGARILAVTASVETQLAQAADTVLVLPARTEVSTLQHAGSLFEQGWLVIGDAISAVVRARLQVPEAALDQRHANLP